MSESFQVIKGIGCKWRDSSGNMQSGRAKYDYNALANIPEQVHLIDTSNGLPTPGASYRGNIVVSFDGKTGRVAPKICLKQGERYAWVNFGIPRIRLSTPRISTWKEKLECAPYIYLFNNKLSTPNIKAYKEKLNNILIYFDGDTLSRPLIYLDIEMLDTPYIELVKDILETPYIYIEAGLHPAILGKAILGSCYLGGTQETESSILGQAQLGKMRLGSAT